MRIVIIYFMLFSITGFSQSIEPKLSPYTPQVVNLQLRTGLQNDRVGTLTTIVRGISVYKTDSQQYYVIYYDRYNRERRKYLGWLTLHTYENSNVFSNQDKTNYWYWQIDDNGIPQKKKLIANIFNDETNAITP